MKEKKEQPRFLSDKITEMEKEVGLIPMTCIETECLYIKFEPTIKKGQYGRNHCREEIPYVKRINGEIKLVGLCIYKIKEYWEEK